MRNLAANLSIRWKILMPLVVMLAAVLLQSGLIMLMDQLRQDDAERINVAGRQRMLSQKMTKETIKFLVSGDANDAQAANATMEAFESALEALMKGGQVNLGAHPVQLAPTKNREILVALTEANSYWKSVKPLFTNNLQKPSAAPAQTAAELQAASVDLLQRFDQITRMYETASSGSISKIMRLVYAFPVIFVAMIIVIWYLTNINLVKPILELRIAAGRIAAGDLTEEENK